jgi:hypothetical protein
MTHVASRKAAHPGIGYAKSHTSGPLVCKEQANDNFRLQPRHALQAHSSQHAVQLLRRHICRYF